MAVLDVPPEVSSPSPPPKSRGRLLLLVAAAVVIVSGVVVFAVGRAGNTGNTHTLVVTLSQYGPANIEDYSSIPRDAIIKEGDEAVVRNESDAIIAKTTLDRPRTGAEPEVFTITLHGVPKAKFYKIKIGTHEGPTYSYSELSKMKWHEDLSFDLG